MNRVKAKSLAFAAVAAAGANLAWAEAPELETSANVTIASEYVFRGQSQTDEHEAIQGGVDLSYGGLYFGVWGSNVDFGPGDNATAEIDYYGGYAFDVTDEVSLDLGVIFYDYPGEADYEYWEVYAGLGWRDLSVGVNYSDEYLGDGGESFYYVYADYSLGLPQDFSLDLHVAQNIGDDQDIAFEGDDFGNGIEDEYTEWSVSRGKSVAGLDFALTYWDTTIDDDKNELGDARIVFSVGKSF